MRVQGDLQPGLRCSPDAHLLSRGHTALHRQMQRHSTSLAPGYAYKHVYGGFGRCSIAPTPPEVNVQGTCKRSSIIAGHAAEAHAHSEGSSSCCGSGHHHYELKETWGPAQQFVFTRILQGTGVIKYSETVAHSTAAAMSSAGLLLVSVYFVVTSSCVLGSFSTVESAIATLAALGSMALSSIPAFTDAIMQVRVSCIGHTAVRSACCLVHKFQTHRFEPTS